VVKPVENFKARKAKAVRAFLLPLAKLTVTPLNGIDSHGCREKFAS